MMEITFNVKDLIGSEEQVANLVADRVFEEIGSSIAEKIDARVNKEIESCLKPLVEKKIKDIIDLEFETEFTPIGNYGSKKEPTTIRAVITEAVQKQCEFRDAKYESERNVFTSTVKTTVAEEMKKFAAEYKAVVNDQLLADSMDYALTNLRKTLKI